MRAAPLADLCEPDRRSVRPGDPLADELPFVGVENVTRDTGFLDFDANSRVGSGKSVAFRFDERHVLYSKLRPYLNKVATPDFAGRCSTQLVPLLPREGVDRDFLAHMLRRGETVEFAVASANGTRMPSVDMKLLMAMPIPFPPFDTQRRIAVMLNRAARIVRLREKTNDRIRECAPALFVKMFGDPEENPMGWPEYPFGNLVTDMTKSVTKIPKTHYNEAGIFPIIDQGKASVAGYADDREGCFAGPLPAIVFGDHTRRFKLVRSRFFLGADGTKLLLPDTVDLDPVFLFGNLLCVSIEDAGYSRHFKYLKEKNLILPPLDKQLQFRDLLESIERIDSAAETAAKAASVLTAALTARLLEQAFARPLRERARTKEMEEMKP